MIWVDHPEHAVLKILRAVHPTAVKLVAEEERIKEALIPECTGLCSTVCVHQSSMNIDLNVSDFIYRLKNLPISTVGESNELVKATGCKLSAVCAAALL